MKSHKLLRNRLSRKSQGHGSLMLLRFFALPSLKRLHRDQGYMMGPRRVLVKRHETDIKSLVNFICFALSSVLGALRGLCNRTGPGI